MCEDARETSSYSPSLSCSDCNLTSQAKTRQDNNASRADVILFLSLANTELEFGRGNDLLREFQTHDATCSNIVLIVLAARHKSELTIADLCKDLRAPARQQLSS